MRIASVSIENYKSFWSSGDLRFSPGFNVVVGQNNVGKTALLEVLGPEFVNSPHKSRKTVPTRGNQAGGNSRVAVTFELEPGEFLDLPNADGLWVPVPEGPGAPEAVESLRAAASRSMTVAATFEGGGTVLGCIRGLTSQTSPRTCVLVRTQRVDQEIKLLSGQMRSNVPPVEQLGTALATLLRSRIYGFKAERMNIGSCQFGGQRLLQPNAANLPEVLNALQPDLYRFERFNELVRAVLPAVQWVAVQPDPKRANHVEIIVRTDPDPDRMDLAIPLFDSGTGIAQVLAVLYVVMTSDFPRVILIDEPQSFLHPAAVRTLFGILKRYEQKHQFIVTTHSPVALSAAEPSTILLLRKEGPETSVEEVDAAEARALGAVLAEVGVRPSDLFGTDEILWVEGRTEEDCFPLILRRTEGLSLLGTKIIGVRSTGELEGKNAEAMFDIYDRFSSKQALLPPALAFVFDRETRTEAQLEDLRRRKPGKAYFLDRRMYENYLLNPAAIRGVMGSVQGFPETTEAAIGQWLAKTWTRDYFERLPAEEERTTEYWQRNVDGAKVLGKLFSHMSGTTVSYEKVKHGLLLTEWLCENAPDDLEEVRTLLKSLLPERVRRLAESSALTQ